MYEVLRRAFVKLREDERFKVANCEDFREYSQGNKVGFLHFVKNGSYNQFAIHF